MSKYTPGLWIIDNAGPTEEYSYQEPLPPIKHLGGCIYTPPCFGDGFRKESSMVAFVYGENKQNADANCRLVAAAPVLLNVLENIQGIFSENLTESKTLERIRECFKEGLAGVVINEVIGGDDD